MSPKIKHLSRPRRWRLAGLLVAAGLAAGWSGPAAGQGALRDTLSKRLRLASMELAHRGPEIVQALQPRQGSAVATFGLTGSRFLVPLLEELGPDGKVIAVCRELGSYRRLRDDRPHGARVEPIFAFDGDSHLEPNSVDLMVLVDVDGFFRRWPDLVRQAQRAVRPGGRLAVLRLPTLEELQAEGTAKRRLGDESRLTLERAGFRWVRAPEVLQGRSVDVYQRDQ